MAQRRGSIKRSGSELNRMIADLMCGVRMITRQSSVGIPSPDPPPPGTAAHLAVRELPRLVAGLSPEHLAQVTLHLEALRDYPLRRAMALEDLGRAAARRRAWHPLARESYVLAATLSQALGDSEALQRQAQALLALAGEPIWQRYARRLLAMKMKAVGTELSSPSECAPVRGLSLATRSGVERVLEVRTYPAGHYLCVEGNHGEELFLIKAGRVAILHSMGSEEAFLCIRHPGDVLGEMAIFAEERRRTASALALEDTKVWALRYDVLDQLLARHRDLRERLEALYHQRRLEHRMAQHPLFVGLDEAERSELYRLATSRRAGPRRLHTGQLLGQAGQPMAGLYLLLDGAVEVRTGPRRRGRALLRQTSVEFPHVLGLEALLADTVWPADVVAVRESWVARFPLRILYRTIPRLREAAARLLVRGAGVPGR
jgi:CRP-like cAMP-binding protein